MADAKETRLNVAQVILRHAEFKHRDDFLRVAANEGHRVRNMTLGARLLGLNDGAAAAIMLTAATDPADTEALYQFSVELMAIIERVEGGEGIDLDPMEYAKNVGPLFLLPFLREAVASLTMRGRFGPVLINPMMVSRSLFTETALEALAEQKG